VKQEWLQLAARLQHRGDQAWGQGGQAQGHPAGARSSAGLARPGVTALRRLRHGLSHYPMVLTQTAGSREPCTLEHGDGSVVQERT
jgi:hypothetical protein